MNSEYGYFSDTGKEFIITTPKIPRHWYNYLWNDSYITFTSQVGFGEGFAQDNLGRRVQLVSDRDVYLLDMETKEYWTANAIPVNKGHENYRCIHGLGYSEIKLDFNGISTSYRIFVPEDSNCEIWTIKVKNKRKTPCNLKLIPYIKTEFDGGYKPQGYNTATGYYDTALHSVIGRSFSTFGTGISHEVYGYLMGDESITGYDSCKNAFIGTYGNELFPEALENNGCTNSSCIAEKLCFALEAAIELKSGEEREFNFIAGIAFDADEIKRTKQRFSSSENITWEFNKIVDKFKNQIDDVKITTPDSDLNNLFNSWLKHQTNMGSRWARVRHNGYRDLVSDCECLGAINPDLAWKRLKRVLSFQYSNGYAPRTFIGGRVMDNNFADCPVWLTFAVYSLLKEKGDLGILDEEVPFNDGSTASVYEHLRRSVEFLWNFRGLHGLVKIWGGDWNDCMNQVGLKGKGVSVWLSIAWYRANKQFEELANLKGETGHAEEAAARSKEMQDIVDTFGWDGEYYLEAYTDDGMKIGSKECDEGKIFILPQLWAVFSGISKNGKDKIAMESVEKYLETELGTLVSWPAYTKIDNHIGTITQKPAGVHENGGVYLHTSMWKLAVDSILKNNDMVQRGLEKILPFNKKWVEKKCEPYIMCNSYFEKDTGYRYGTAGQSWRTASGAWLTKALVSYIFGLQPEMEGLKINPCLPPDWKSCSITKKFRKAVYHITYEQVHEGSCSNIAEILVNGKVHSSSILPYKDNELYTVKVILG